MREIHALVKDAQPGDLRLNLENSTHITAAWGCSTKTTHRLHVYMYGRTLETFSHTGTQDISINHSQKSKSKVSQIHNKLIS